MTTKFRRFVQYATLGIFVLTLASPSGAQSVSTQPLPLPLPPAVLLPSDAAAVEGSIRFLENRVKHNPEDFIAYNQLAGLYLQRVRESGDLTYLNLASRAAHASLATLPAEQNTGGLTALAQFEYAAHGFIAARDHARRLTELLPGKVYPFLILGDALLELGEYDHAEAALRQMEQLGGIQGLTRVAMEQRLARLAALRGDMDAARRYFSSALTLALALPVPPRETIAWCRWQLGETAFAIGDYATAERHHRDALITFPDYFRALASLGRVRAARGDLSAAIEYYKRAVGIIPDPNFVATLGDLLALNGKTDEAKKQYDLVEYIGKINALNQSLYNRELAYFYADHDIKPQEGLELARRELDYRHDIYAYDALAWNLFRNGKLDEARDAIEKALKLGTKDAKLFYHAALIFHRLGEMDKAKEHLNRALSTNPHFHILFAGQAVRMFEEFEKSDAAVAVNRQIEGR